MRPQKYSQAFILSSVKKYGLKLRIIARLNPVWGPVFSRHPRERRLSRHRFCRYRFLSRTPGDVVAEKWNPSCFVENEPKVPSLTKQLALMYKYDRNHHLRIEELRVGDRVLLEPKKKRVRK